MIALVAGCTCAEPRAPAPPPAHSPPNLLLIVADDLGTDKVGLYGETADAPPTPSLDALAREGLRFRSAYANPVCSTSRAALMTGRYGRRTGIGGVIDERDTWELPLAEVTLPEVLDRVGYEPVALGKWHLSGPSTPSAATHPNLQGFDHYAGAPGQLAGTRRLGDGLGGPYFEFEKVTDGRKAVVRRYATTDTTDDAIRWLGELEPPWLLYVAYHAPHAPLHVPPEELVPRDRKGAPTDREKHDAAIRALDAELGRLVASLTAEQRATTLVVFTSDNGTDRQSAASGGEAKGSVYEGGVHVPLIAAGPGIPPGTETDALVHLVDVLPTFAELAGVDVTDLVLDGRSFAPVLANPVFAGWRRMVYVERFAPLGPGPYDLDLAAVRDERYKVIRDRRGEVSFHDLAGRTDDGPPLRLSTLRGREAERYDALVDELTRVSARSSPR